MSTYLNSQVKAKKNEEYKTINLSKDNYRSHSFEVILCMWSRALSILQLQL